jgi:hypothetical protein
MPTLIGDELGFGLGIFATKGSAMELIIGGSFVVLALAFVGVTLACTQCRDGWRSRSTGRGTCSWHGGIDDD